ncbi:hypothetical protein SMICM17S_10534 [Streptomyces microflavus]
MWRRECRTAAAAGPSENTYPPPGPVPEPTARHSPRTGTPGALSVDPGAPQVTAPAGLPAAPEAGGLKAARRTGFLVTMVLGGLTALPPLSMDMYLRRSPRSPTP